MSYNFAVHLTYVKCGFLSVNGIEYDILLIFDIIQNNVITYSLVRDKSMQVRKK